MIKWFPRGPMFRASSILTSFVLATALGVAACDEIPTGPAPVTHGSGLTVLLTDAPGDVQAAVVTISKIYLHGDRGRTSLIDEAVTADLLQLRNKVATLVQGVDVPPGRYSELRLVIEGGYIQVETAGGGSRIYASSPDYEGLPDGARVAGKLHMPSLGSSGLKIKLPRHLQVGRDESIILIDFDVRESFGHQAGKSGKWVMHPVIRAADVTFGGHLLAQLRLGSGVVLPPVGGQEITLAAFTARLTPAGGGSAADLPLSDVDGDAVFEAMFKALAPGAYDLTFIGPAGLTVSFDSALPRTVTIAAKQTTTETVTLTSASAGTSITATLRLDPGVTLPTGVSLASFRARLTPFPFGTARELGFTDPNSDATFEAAFTNLDAGTYLLAILPPAGVSATFSPTSPVLVSIAQNATVTRAFVVTSAGGS
jgi:hypothetical protein